MAQPTTNELLPALFGHAEHPLAQQCAGVLDCSAPLRSFAWTHRTKIRKKVRNATNSAITRDLRCDLAVAALLAADRRHTLTYEPLAAANQRGPDFLLPYKDHTPVYVEVSRIRPRVGAARDPHERLAAAIVGKLAQLANDDANLLVLVNDDESIAPAEISAVVQRLRRKAEAKDDAYFAFRGLEGARAFQHQIVRLSGVMLATPADGSQGLATLLGARRPLPPELARTVNAWDLVALLGAPDVS
ncbi:MAG: hypothetical protein MI924_08960 [Chloroflexales bacterium]|nr:hypothetical protein [Chloroflexales bacterium]